MSGKFYFYLVCLFFLISNRYYSQAANFIWAKNFSGLADDRGYAMSVDASGNVYVTGKFSGTVDFDPSSSVFNMTPFGFSDIFICKLNSYGALIWAKQLGGNSSDEGRSISVDSNGNVYTTGFFVNTADFDPGTGVYNLTGSSNDVFISKLDQNGNFVWAKKLGGAGQEQGNSIKVDASANVYLTGKYNANADFDPSASTYTLAPNGLEDIFISKLDVNGNFVWAKSIGGGGSDEGLSLALDNSNNVYTTGYFYSVVDFDPGPGVFSVMSSGGPSDIFVSKLDVSGNFVWAKKMGSGGTNDDYGNSIAIDGMGNVLTTGFFWGTADFDPSSAGVYNLIANSGSADVFVSKLDASGNFVWAKNMGGFSADYGYSIISDNNNNVYTTGFYQGTADFDPSASTYNLTSSGGYDIFINKLDATGNFVWAKSVGGSSGADIGYSIFVDPSFNIYTTGQFSFTGDFDPDINTFTLTSGGSNDSFVLKLGPCATPLPPGNTTSLSNQTICAGLSTVLTATASGSINWYSSSSSTVSLYSGSTYTTSPLSAGVYTYFAESSTCTISATRTPITVTVNTSPTLTIVSSNSMICIGNSATLSVIGANSFTWSPSGTGTSITITPTTTTTYTVTGTNSFGCINSNTITQQVSSCTYQDEIFVKSIVFSIYPNPTKNTLIFSTPRKDLTNFKFTILNTLGEIVLVSNSSEIIDVSNLPSGIYSFIISNSVECKNIRFVKE